MSRIPQNHVNDALSMVADGKIDLFRLNPLSGGTICIKDGSDETWLGDTYFGVPMQFSGDNRSNDGSTPTPRLQIGQQDLDLLPFKGLIFEGYLDGAAVTRKTILLDDLINQRNVARTLYYRVRRVENYSRTQISLVLSTYSAATGQTIPFRQYVTPDFPFVTLS